VFPIPVEVFAKPKTDRCPLTNYVRRRTAMHVFNVFLRRLNAREQIYAYDVRLFDRFNENLSTSGWIRRHALLIFD
jgi:hypothetical protein